MGNVSSYSQLMDIAKNAYGSGFFEGAKGGNGYVGQYTDSNGRTHVVKVLTHRDERSDHAKAAGRAGTEELARATEQLKANLIALAGGEQTRLGGEIKAMLEAAQRKAAEDKMTAQGEGGQVGLLSRKIVAQAVSAIAQSETVRNENGVAFSWNAVNDRNRAATVDDTTAGTVNRMLQQNWRDEAVQNQAQPEVGEAGEQPPQGVDNVGEQPPPQEAGKPRLPTDNELSGCREWNDLSQVSGDVFRSGNNVDVPSAEEHQRIRNLVLKKLIRIMLEGLGSADKHLRTDEENRDLLGKDLYDKLISPNEDMTFDEVDEIVTEKCRAFLNPPNLDPQFPDLPNLDPQFPDLPNLDPQQDELPPLETLKGCFAKLEACKTADDVAELLSKALAAFPGLAAEGKPSPGDMCDAIIQKYCELSVKDVLDQVDSSLWAARENDVRSEFDNSITYSMGELQEIGTPVTRERVDAALAPKLREIVCGALPSQHRLAALDAVMARTQGRTIKEQCLIHAAFLTGYCEMLQKERNGISIQDFAATFDFGAALGEGAPDADVPPLATHWFMSAFVERFRGELDVQGKVNSNLAEIAQNLNDNTKYQNVSEAMRLVLKFRGNPKRYQRELENSVAIGDLMRKRYEAESAKPGSVDEARFVADYQKILPKKKDKMIKEEYAKFVVAKRNQEELQKENPGLISYPSSLTRIGQSVGTMLGRAMKVGAHADINTAEQMLASFNAFCSIHELFFKCLEEDFQKQDPAMPAFHKLLDAMDMPGCLQARVEPLQMFKVERDLGVDMADLKKDVAVQRGDDLAQGMGKVVRRLYEEKQDELKYDDVVDGYLKSIGESWMVKLGLRMPEIEERLKNDFGGKTEVGGVVVPMTRELLNDPGVKAAIKGMFVGIIEA